jgi:hypothetical protein
MALLYPIVIITIKLKNVHTTSYFLGLSQHNNLALGAPLDLVFTNINDFCVPVSDYTMVAPDNYHHPLHVDLKLTVDYQPTFSTPRHSYNQGDYVLLYNTLSNCDWSNVLDENYVDFVVYNFIVGVFEVINEAIPPVQPRPSNSPYWFSKSLIYYIKNKISFKKYKKIEFRLPL